MDRSERVRSDEADSSSSSLSRRGFIILSTASAAVGTGETVGAEAAATGASDRTADLVLEREDLPDAESYVEWAVDPASAPLATTLADAVEGFDPATGAANGFVATSAAEGPRSIESAVYPGSSPDAVVAATDTWVHQARDDPDARTVRHEPASGVVQWETTYSDGLDVLRLDRLPDGTLSFTGATGAGTASRSVRRWVVRCADVTRDRAYPK